MSIDAMKQALDALEPYARQVVEKGDDYEIAKCDPKVDTAIVALRLAIEQAEKQEPVLWERRPDGKIGPTVWAGVDFDIHTAPPQRQPHELLCVCGASWSIDGEGNEELLSTPPQRQPLQVDKDGWYWVSENECISVDLIRTVEKLHGIGGEA